MNHPPPLRLAGIGCGSRTRTYLTLAARMPHLYAIEGAADPIPERVAAVRQACGDPAGFRSFSSADELLAADNFADVVVVGTQDNYHFTPCLAAMEKGYDVLLEKPIATRLEEIVQLERRARELQRKVLVCHVLRYTPFYRKVKEIVASGLLGEVISLNATEGVSPWHQAHSFVRGSWSVVEESSPMIVAKCCHDLDIIAWLMDRPCRRLASYGSLTWFRPENAPAGAPARCTEGCPVGDDCTYNALLYAAGHRHWLQHVMDGAAAASRSEIVRWLEHSPWGRCVYRCGNTAVDHQVVAMEFAGGATATLTMTAFEKNRRLEIFGTRGVLHGTGPEREDADADLTVRFHANDETHRIKTGSTPRDDEGHFGGDHGLMLALHEEMRKRSPDAMSTSLAASLQSHLMAFAAEHARTTGQSVNLATFLSHPK